MCRKAHAGVLPHSAPALHDPADFEKPNKAVCLFLSTAVETAREARTLSSGFADAFWRLRIHLGAS